ncbi:glycosyltransferase [Methylobacterium goesingense]|uniref:Glycosyltransferase involved in cell wall biosynthesis n=1 Tax=Methylobacterium goesingense TaxID=243690 RepID=A0ABV2L1N9_9HYPH|nr:glycosyltransferase [Methylobacterium goesingense]GJD73711.1 D-inositol-3-phosphate glycosyltransferase [Methylobacterium goesingense]
MTGPRVLFINHTSTMSGAELVLADVVRAWRGATAFLFEDGPLNAAMAGCGLRVERARAGGGLTGLRRSSSPLRALPMAGRLAALVLEIAGRARRADVIYANSQKAFVLGALATGIVRRPLIWHLHDIIDPLHFGTAQRRLQVGLANARATCVIAPSTAVADAFVAAGGRRDRVAIVPNGLDLVPDPRSRAELRRAAGLPSGLLVGVFSRLASWKGQHVLLHALAELPGVGAVVAGAPLFGEDAYAAELVRLAAELGIADRVHFLGQRSDVALLMQAVEVVVHPSIHPEPFGRTLVEAMLAGVPLVATRTGAAAEILDEGAFGTLVPPGDAAALAEGIRRILAGNAGGATQVAAASERARTRYGADGMRDAIAGIIRRVAEGGRA